MDSRVWACAGHAHEPGGLTVAREYGIPAVVGIGESIHSIREGDRLLVNGDTGEITILEQSSLELSDRQPI